MKRTTISFLPVKIIMFSMVLLFFGCSKENDGPIPSGDKINFKINIKNDKEKKATLHPTSSVDFTTTFKEGDEIGMFATTAGTSLLASGNPIHNFKLTYNGTGWDGDVDWPSVAGNYDFYAYYPYQPNPSVENPLNPLAIPYTASASNEGLNGFAKADLMSGAVKSVVKGGNVEIEFSHKLALMQVEVSKGAGLGKGPDETLAVTMYSGFGKGNLNLSDNSFLGVSEIFTHYFYRVEQPSSPDYSSKFTYRTYLPAQTLPFSEEIISLKNSDNDERKYILPGGAELKAGQAKIIKLDFLIPQQITP